MNEHAEVARSVTTEQDRAARSGSGMSLRLEDCGALFCLLGVPEQRVTHFSLDIPGDDLATVTVTYYPLQQQLDEALKLLSKTLVVDIVLPSSA